MYVTEHEKKINRHSVIRYSLYAGTIKAVHRVYGAGMDQLAYRLAHGQDTRLIIVGRFHLGIRDLSLLKASRSAMGPIRTTVRGLQGSSGVKRPGRGTDHSHVDSTSRATGGHGAIYPLFYIPSKRASEIYCCLAVHFLRLKRSTYI